MLHMNPKKELLRGLWVIIPNPCSNFLGFKVNGSGMVVWEARPLRRLRQALKQAYMTPNSRYLGFDRG